MVRKWLTYLGYFVGMAVIVALMSFASYKHSQKNISGVDIDIVDYDNAKFVNDEVIEKMIALSYDSLTYRKRSSIDVAKVEEEVKKLSSVENADVFVDIDGKLSVKVKQKNPIGRIYTKKYNSYLDDKGKLMPLSSLFTADVPIITGDVKDENLDEIFLLLDYIRSNEVLREQIVSVSAKKYNEYEFRTRKGNQVIEFGKANNIEKKFNKLLIYYRKTVSDFGWKRYKKINLEFANQVVCTKR